MSNDLGAEPVVSPAAPSPVEPRGDTEIRADLAEIRDASPVVMTPIARIIRDAPAMLAPLSAALAAKEAAEADRDDAREFVRSSQARADRAERHADGLRRRVERAEGQLRAVEALCDRLDAQPVAPFGTSSFVETVRAALAAAAPSEPDLPLETRVEYGHQTLEVGWVPEHRGIKYASHQRTVHFRVDEPLLLDHWSDPNGVRKPVQAQGEATP